MGFVTCPKCARHVRRDESACPFCSVSVVARIAEVPERIWPSARLGRAALMALATTSIGACSDDSGGSHVSHYGAPIFIGSAGSGGASATTTDSGTASDADADAASDGGAVGVGGRSAAPH
jgi:hypothetical protein